MKISILQNCSLTKEEATSELEALDITVVQKLDVSLFAISKVIMLKTYYI